MTRASDLRPVRRVMSSRLGEEYVVEVKNQILTVRPKGARRGGKLEVDIPIGAAYQRALIMKLDQLKREKKAARRRGK